MGRKAIFSLRAIEDLEAIVRYIAEDSPSRARSFGDTLVARTKLLITKARPQPSPRKIAPACLIIVEP